LRLEDEIGKPRFPLAARAGNVHYRGFMSSRRQYPFNLIEPKWQRFWEQQETFRAWNPGEPVPAGHPFAVRHAQTLAGGKLPPKHYILDMFPYPSGAGLHVGHPEGYTATDILSRYRRACGYNVLHPMGWDAFGLPAEQYAIKTGQHPRITTEQNIANFKRQIKALGFSYDWSREVDTTNPGYVKWTQWIFLQLYNSWFNPATNKAEPIETLSYPRELQTEEQKRAYRDSKRLAYVSEAPVNWCPELGTVLANEEVIDGKSEVGGFPVIRRPMRQWMLRITAYAEKLLNDLDIIDWTDSLKEMQRNWIGRSEGAEVDFRVVEGRGSGDEGQAGVIRVFTTRPDTLFGATYMVLSPEHKLVDLITAPEQREAVQKYKDYAATKSDLERTELAKEKTGVFTGAHAINPVNGAKIPIWIADYVLISYGTGAIMAVPAHDTRDFEFATKFNLPIVQVVQPPDPQTDWRGFVDDGTSVNSTGPEISITGLPTPEAKRKITAWLEEKGLGKKMVNYKLRDWLFSRQRYWGEPFPIVWKEGHHEALPATALPVLPPTLDDFKPTRDGQPPLARATEWLSLPGGATRETNTMPQWAGSCWYYLRYLDARNDKAFCAPAVEGYWMGTDTSAVRTDANLAPKPIPGVNLYVGGTEHAVLHLLYARFWHKVLYDLGHVSTPEPFFKLVNQGLILGEMEYTLFQDKQGRPVSAARIKDIAEEATPAGPQMVGIHVETGEKLVGRRLTEDDVEKAGHGFALKGEPGILVDARSFKMSKSRGNVVNPDQILADFGADAFRLYEMFMGPLEMVKPWSTKGVEGPYRFLGRVWRLFVDEQSFTDCEQEMTAAPEQAEDLLGRIKLHTSIKEVAPSPAQLKALHVCIRKVTDDLENLRFNTAISAMMVFVNEAQGWEVRPWAVMRDFLALLQPFAPHLAEELWSKLHRARGEGEPPSLAYAPWPAFDPALLVEAIVEIPVQVNGKLRGRITVPAESQAAEIEKAALEAPALQPFLAGKPIKKTIYIPRKMLNLVVG